MRVPGVGRRVQREDLSKLVWSVTRAAVSQSRCDKVAKAIAEESNSDGSFLTIAQCERVLREIEMQECDKFLKAAENFLKKRDDKNTTKATRHHAFLRPNLCLPGVCCAPEPTKEVPDDKIKQLSRRTDNKNVSS